MPHPSGGYKLANGTRVPGVTTILGRWKDSGGLINWAWQQGRDGFDLNETRDKAADVGTYAHALVEAYINGDIVAPEIPKGFTDEQIRQAHSALASFRAWEKHSRLVIVEQEMSLVSEAHRFGGTPDAIGMVHDEPAMIDWKSSKAIYYDYIIQVAAYLHLYEENFPDRKLTGGIHIVRFGKGGTEFDHRHIAIDAPRLALAWRQFLLFREAYDNDKQLKAT